MAFRDECKFLDKTQMSRPVQYNKLTHGIEPVIGAIHYICQRDENFGWISNCPGDCAFYEE